MMTQIIRVIGMVQGIGYRPFVMQLAEESAIRGQVKNTAGIVIITATASKETLARFVKRLQSEMPYGARVDQVTVEEIPLQEFHTFSIVPSSIEDDTNATGIPLVPPDLATCPDCERELMEKGNLRQGYPFISCVKCGPRYSIIDRLPYDRERTTMRDFNMCPECRDDYTSKGNIRRHAQTISCPNCGPQLILEEYQQGTVEQGEIKTVVHKRYYAFRQAVEILLSGGILAVKDIGGFHLVCLPTKEQTLYLLRQIKNREKKPFAVMFENISQAEEYCLINKKEEKLLESNARPIVLLKRKKKALFAPDVCGDSPDVGAMLPCNPLQILLVKSCGPLIMTSANLSGQPIIISNEQVCTWMKQNQLNYEEMDLRLGVLMHERRILMPLEDSIVRVIKNRVQIFRRARGYVPEPVILKEESKKQMFATGGDLKSTFCYMAGKRVYLSQQIGDLESLEVNQIYHENIRHMHELFGFRPEEIATDCHPDYITVKNADKLRDYFHMGQSSIRQIQHHQAHVASVIAEHELKGQILGVAFDGTGYGTDHSIWGSEFFLVQNDIFQRVAHLQPVELIGGDEGAKNTDLILCGYLTSFGISEVKLNQWMSWLKNDELRQKQKIIAQAIEHKINTVTSTSMGRLFDAVSAFLNICHYNDYEGEAAIELEYLAASLPKQKRGKYPLHLDVVMGNHMISTDTKGLFEHMIDAISDGATSAQLAYEFIIAIADYVVSVCTYVNHWNQNKHALMKESKNLKQIALSGGTFQNRILLEQVIDKLEKKGYSVYMNEKVPSGDGGICLGQAYLLMKADRAECEREAYVYCNTRKSD